MKPRVLVLLALLLAVCILLTGCGGRESENANGVEDGEDIQAESGWEVEEGKRITDPYFFDVCVIQLDDGTYRMYGETRQNIESYVSSDGLSWQKEEGVRMPDAAFPFVTRLPDGRFRMFYVPSGGPGMNQDNILSAISSDGIDFTTEAGFRYKASSNYEERLSSPRVIRLDDGTYRMYFTASSGPPDNELVLILSASSTDGLSFTRDEGIRIDPRNADLLGERAAHAWPIKTSEGEIELFFQGVHRHGGAGILSAVSQDGLEFSVKSIPAIQEKERGLSPQDPCIVPIPGGLRMYYGIYRGPEVVEESAIYSAVYRED